MGWELTLDDDNYDYLSFIPLAFALCNKINKSSCAQFAAHEKRSSFGVVLSLCSLNYLRCLRNEEMTILKTKY
ncbi:CLUMA_CG007106, isoform A [Clunio marinus]|uniref:CLUMA_CG007106, isoform A n=1 Tax=Clunio marinus TaxID=568069 RepID=A0A1J1HZX3_9DIPT|nr:CLUMA_CG007106, isoform A [Clunio marinus]